MVSGHPAEMVLMMLVKMHHDGEDIQVVMDKTPHDLLLKSLEFSRVMLDKTKSDLVSTMRATMGLIEDHLGLDKIRVKCVITQDMEGLA